MANIRKVGVIGAGQMGGGIAHVAALAGFDVRLNDAKPEVIKSAIATINGNMSRQVKRELITEEQRQAALKKISSAETLDALSDCDLVIEAAVEKEDV
jgi:3-hydroxybutyryl-CoA dehydrogenase